MSFISSMKKVVLCFIFICVSINAFGADQQIVVSSIPKCGTHLLLRALQLLTNQKPLWVCQNTLNAWISETRDDILVNHYTYDQYTEQLLRDNNALCFFIYRDPRDMVLSYSNWELKVRKHQYEGLSKKELMIRLITGEQGFHHHPQYLGLESFYRAFLGWIDSDVMCSIRFEDLVGPQGGGSKTKQLAALKKIAEHLNISLSEEELELIPEKLFGMSYTFQRGKIGSWKEAFDQEDIEIFKIYSGSLLLELDYEKGEDLW